MPCIRQICARNSLCDSRFEFDHAAFRLVLRRQDHIYPSFLKQCGRNSELGGASKLNLIHGVHSNRKSVAMIYASPNPADRELLHRGPTQTTALSFTTHVPRGAIHVFHPPSSMHAL